MFRGPLLNLLWVLCLWVAQLHSAAAAESVCGVFRVEGTLRESARYPGNLEFVTDAGSLSERRFVLGPMDRQELGTVKELRVAGKLRMLHFCMGECFGEWLGTERILGPDEKPKSFAAAPASIRVTQEKCLETAVARKRVLK